MAKELRVHQSVLASCLPTQLLLDSVLVFSTTLSWLALVRFIQPQMTHLNAYLVEIFGQKRTVQVWNYVSIMLVVGFNGGPPIGQWFTTQIVGQYDFDTFDRLAQPIYTHFKKCNCSVALPYKYFR